MDREKTGKIAPKPIPTKEIKAILDGWLAKYGKIHVMSYNSKYLQGYVRLLAKLGFQVGQEDDPVEGKPAYYIGKSDAMAPSRLPDERESVMASQTILAANYEEMFQSILKLGDQTKGTNIVWPIQLPTIKAEIDWCKKTLKKQDRIVWWLRWYRLSILEETRNKLEKDYEAAEKTHAETEMLYNELKPQAEGEQPKRYAVPIVHEQEAERVKTQSEGLQQRKNLLDQVRVMVEKEEKVMGNRIGRELQGYPHISISWFVRNHTTFQHFLSLPTQKIQNVVWDKQTPDGLTTEFQVAEKEWQEQTKGTLVPNLEPVYTSEEAQRIVRMRQNVEYHLSQGNTETAESLQEEIKKLEAEIAERGEQPEVDTVFIKFPDGWAWWKLSRAYCSEEARAMGHCGNVVGQDKPDERILSLRKPVKAGKEDRWEPHLTFILEPNGLLGEMKGKANQKPVAAYHKYIIPLLEDPRIKGIRGGGYAPERNFSMNDLPKEEQDRLIAAKPALMNCEQYLQRVGFDDSLIERINSMLEWDVRTDKKLPGFVVNKFKSLDEFIQERGNDDAKYAGKVLTGDEDLDTSYDYNEWEYAIENLKSKQQDMVANYIRGTYPDEVAAFNEENDEFDGSDSDIKRIIEEQGLEEVRDMLGRAMETGRRYGIEGQMYKALTRAIDDMEDDEENRLHISVHYGSYTDPKTGKKSPVWDSPVEEYFTPQAAAKLADSGSTYDQLTENEYGRGSDTPLNISAPYNGWDEFDDDAFRDEIEESFASPETPEEVAKQQQEMEDEAKKRPDLIPVRQAVNGKSRITGWQRNPDYKGPALGPGGVLWDTENNKPLAAQKPKAKPTKKRKTKKRKSHLLNQRDDA